VTFSSDKGKARHELKGGMKDSRPSVVHAL
jgi:hypothetical protein